MDDVRNDVGVVIAIDVHTGIAVQIVVARATDAGIVPLASVAMAIPTWIDLCFLEAQGLSTGLSREAAQIIPGLTQAPPIWM